MLDSRLMLNSRAPDFTLLSTDGEQIRLSEVLKSGNALLVFLRHLGWIPCREHVVQLCDHQSEFADLDTRILIISFSTLGTVQQWLQETCPNFTVLLDREREVYKTYRLERSYWRSRSLRTRWAYFKAWLAGKKTHDSHGDDTSQLGGDFIVDRNGILRLVHPSYDPVDRPSVDELIEVINKLPKS